MQQIRRSNRSVVTGICDPNKSQARHHRSLELDSNLKYLKIIFKIILKYISAMIFRNAEISLYIVCIGPVKGT